MQARREVKFNYAAQTSIGHAGIGGGEREKEGKTEREREREIVCNDLTYRVFQPSSYPLKS